MDFTACARSGFTDAITFRSVTALCARFGIQWLPSAMYWLLAALAERSGQGGQRVDTSVIGALVRLQDLVMNQHFLIARFPRFNRQTAQNPMFNFYRASDGKCSSGLLQR